MERLRLRLVGWILLVLQRELEGVSEHLSPSVTVVNLTLQQVSLPETENLSTGIRGPNLPEEVSGTGRPDDGVDDVLVQGVSIVRQEELLVDLLHAALVDLKAQVVDEVRRRVVFGNDGDGETGENGVCSVADPQLNPVLGGVAVVVLVNHPLVLHVLHCEDHSRAAVDQNSAVVQAPFDVDAHPPRVVAVHDLQLLRRQGSGLALQQHEARDVGDAGGGGVRGPHGHVQRNGHAVGEVAVEHSELNLMHTLVPVRSARSQ